MNIRASMLPSYPDCPRRAVARQYRRKFEKLGYQFRELPPSVGAAAGTAVHLSTAEMNRALWRGEHPDINAAVEQAIMAFRKETAPGCEWDDTTPNSNTAEFQIRRMTEIYQPRMPLTINGEPAVEIGGEAGLRANAGDGYVLTGHPDLIDVDMYMDDTKTGSVVRPYQAQLGGYSLLVRSNSLCKLAGVGMTYIPRMGKTKMQKPPILTSYPVPACERAAMGVIRRIKSDMALFDESGNLESFSCNQMSMMCTSRYCPAWGTAFCELTGK